MSTVAVFDIGKTNIKLSATEASGKLLETLSTPNVVHDGPPYRHHDLAATEAWLLKGLAELNARHQLSAIVFSAHGSGGVLIGKHGALMPMMDYEQPLPEIVDRKYREIAGSFRERGSSLLLGAAHLARQMLWLELFWPDMFKSAKAFLAAPQYWAWRLSGILSSEVTSLAAQSHLWSSADSRPAGLIAERGWERLLPPLMPAWTRLGPITGDIAEKTGLARDTAVLCGIHDSSANFYQYQAAGLSDMTVVSTGTWIVAISDGAGPDFDQETAGLCCNADVHRQPLPGVLTMGGREFSKVAADDETPTDEDTLSRLIETRTMALPTFGDDDGLFPGTARKGTVIGPMAEEKNTRHSLALLYTALLTDRCLQVASTSTIILDGSFVRDPLFGAIIAALNPDRRVLINLDSYGTATGAALLATHEERNGPAELSLEPARKFYHPSLFEYRDEWIQRATHMRTD